MFSTASIEPQRLHEIAWAGRMIGRAAGMSWAALFSLPKVASNYGFSVHEWPQGRFARRKAAGLCQLCGEVAPDGRCGRCRLKGNAALRRNRNRDRAAGTCTAAGCLASAEPGRKQCREHLAYFAAASDRARSKRRELAAERLSAGLCVECSAEVDPGAERCVQHDQAHASGSRSGGRSAGWRDLRRLAVDLRNMNIAIVHAEDVVRFGPRRRTG